MEFPDLGKNCSICASLDFLPYECFWCHKVYCGSHRDRTAHTCPVPNARDNIADCATQTTESHLIKCSHCRVPVPDIEISCCHLCHAQVCLPHRFPEQHKCAVKAEKQAEKTTSTIKPVIKPIVTPAGPKGTQNLALARRVGVMKLKQKAKGLNSIPTDNRVYLSVHTHESIRSTSTSSPFFIDSFWSIGRAIDYLTDELNIINDNNKHDAQKRVVLYWGTPKELSLKSDDPEQTAHFDSGTSVKDLVAQETLGSGDNVTLAYIDAN